VLLFNLNSSRGNFHLPTSGAIGGQIDDVINALNASSDPAAWPAWNLFP
jgi:hypothetical protein